MLDLAVALALGGDCPADVGVLRAEPGVYGHVAFNPTVPAGLDTLAADVDKALPAIEAVRAGPRYLSDFPNLRRKDRPRIEGFPSRVAWGA